jgi:small subunit ribosomal protein S20
MPITRSAKKRLKQNKKRRLKNRSIKAYLKTITKKVRNAEEKTEAENFLKEAYKAYDKAVAKGVIHKNNAARHKSRLTMFISKKFVGAAESVTPKSQPETSS